MLTFKTVSLHFVMFGRFPFLGRIVHMPNASISGATLENIDETIKLAKSKVFDKTR
jgi:hypothetical protein